MVASRIFLSPGDSPRKQVLGGELDLSPPSGPSQVTIGLQEAERRPGASVTTMASKQCPAARTGFDGVQRFEEGTSVATREVTDGVTPPVRLTRVAMRHDHEITMLDPPPALQARSPLPVRDGREGLQGMQR